MSAHRKASTVIRSIDIIPAAMDAPRAKEEVKARAYGAAVFPRLCGADAGRRFMQ